MNSFDRNIFRKQTGSLLVVPIIFLVTCLVLRENAGHFWIWSNVDPDYWYLLDSLNMINLNWPEHVAHPGTTVQAIGAIVIKMAHPFSSIDQINRLVLSDPESYLGLIGRVLIAINTVALFAVGLAGYAAFRDTLAVLLLQLAPFLSKLSFKHGLHVSPEPLIITTILVFSILVLLSLHQENFDKYRHRYAIAFGFIAGFAIATKITMAGMLLLPVFLLGRFKSNILYLAMAILAAILFTLPAAGSYAKMFDWIWMIFLGSQHFGGGTQNIIDLDTYPFDLLKLFGRPIFTGVLLLSLLTLIVAWRKKCATAQPYSPETKALAGLSLAFFIQALIVAKHPAGHYMIPALVACGLGMTLIYRQWILFAGPESRVSGKIYSSVFLFITALIIALTLGIFKLNREFVQRTETVVEYDDSKFSQCARIYFWPASSPAYAMYMGIYNTGNTFNPLLKELMPKGAFMYDHVGGQLKDWDGDIEVGRIIDNYPCIYARGNKPENFRPLLESSFSNLQFTTACSTPDETIYTSGVTCQGQLVSR